MAYELGIVLLGVIPNVLLAAPMRGSSNSCSHSQATRLEGPHQSRCPRGHRVPPLLTSPCCYGTFITTWPVHACGLHSDGCSTHGRRPPARHSPQHDTSHGPWAAPTGRRPSLLSPRCQAAWCSIEYGLRRRIGTRWCSGSITRSLGSPMGGGTGTPRRGVGV